MQVNNEHSSKSLNCNDALITIPAPAVGHTGRKFLGSHWCPQEDGQWVWFWNHNFNVYSSIILRYINVYVWKGYKIQKGKTRGETTGESRQNVLKTKDDKYETEKTKNVTEKTAKKNKRSEARERKVRIKHTHDVSILF